MILPFFLLVRFFLHQRVEGLSKTHGVGEDLISSDSAGTKLPHIIYVIADDLGYHDVGYTGSGIKTPTLDRLARDGRTLDNYYVQPSCAPTRATILTGRHMGHHGVLIPFEDGVEMALSESEVLLPTILKRAGYRTHAVGKWHLGFYKEKYTPTFRGFETFYGFYGMGENYKTHMCGSGYDFRIEDRPNCGIGCSVVDRNADGQYSTDLFTNRSLELIRHHRKHEPLFLYLAWQAVHAPLPENCARPEFANWGNWTGSSRDTMFACTLQIADDGLGQIIDLLEKRDMLKNSLIIFSSDNGGAISTNEVAPDDVGSSNWPLRGGKHTLYEGGVRVNGIVWAGWWSDAGRSALQRNYDGLMGAVDWIPTLLDAAGIPRSPNLEGVSHWSALAFNDDPPRDGLFVAAALFGGGMSYAYRKNNWKLIMGVAATGNIGWGWSGPSGSVLTNETLEITADVELYDLANDLAEKDNVVFSYGGVKERLYEELVPYILPEKSLLMSEAPLKEHLPTDGVWGPWKF
jgi:arylsulfatase A-like enzyme